MAKIGKNKLIIFLSLLLFSSISFDSLRFRSMLNSLLFLYHIVLGLLFVLWMYLLEQFCLIAKRLTRKQNEKEKIIGLFIIFFGLSLFLAFALSLLGLIRFAFFFVLYVFVCVILSDPELRMGIFMDDHFMIASYLNCFAKLERQKLFDFLFSNCFKNYI